MAAWSPYGKGFPAGSGLTWAQLNEVAHVTHVRSAQRILEDAAVKRTLVYDESVLNKTRTTVSWVSPNYWSNGFRYGTTRFTFPWADLVEGMNLYWVEVIKDYTPHACRFLLTSQPLKTALKYLVSYDPTADDGPLRRAGSSWYWRSDITLEVMVDRDLSLNRCTGIDFVQHHPDYCNEHDPNCPEKRLAAHAAGGRVIGALIGLDRKSFNRKLVDTSTPSGLKFAIEGALAYLYTTLNPQGKAKGPITRLEQAKDVISSAFLNFSHEQIQAAKDLTKSLVDEDLFDNAFRELVGEHFRFGKLIFSFD